MTLVSGNIRIVPIFEGVPWRGGVVIENLDFHCFRRYFFNTLRNKVNVIV